MGTSHGIHWALVFIWLGSAQSDPEFCNRGFQIAGKYQACWSDASYANPYSGFRSRTFITPELFQSYATHMCRNVKPIAMNCLRDETSSCRNQEKLLQIADESGGACLHNDLNPQFKELVIDRLVGLPGNSPCFQIGESSYDCYVKAGEKALALGESHVDISQFHRVADTFFGHIWDCHIKVFKDVHNECENWQIPMLLSLQKTAMPSLFGMHLNPGHVAKLELEPSGNTSTVSPTTAPTSIPFTDGDDDKEVETYLMIRVIKDKKEAHPGDIVIQLSSKQEQRELSVVSGPSFDEDLHNLVEQLLDSKGKLDMQKVRQKMREDRKKQKEVEEFLNRIKAADRKSQREKKKKEREQRKQRGRRPKPVRD